MKGSNLIQALEHFVECRFDLCVEIHFGGIFRVLLFEQGIVVAQVANCLQLLQCVHVPAVRKIETGSDERV